MTKTDLIHVFAQLRMDVLNLLQRAIASREAGCKDLVRQAIDRLANAADYVTDRVPECDVTRLLRKVEKFSKHAHLSPVLLRLAREKYADFVLATTCEKVDLRAWAERIAAIEQAIAWCPDDESKTRV